MKRTVVSILAALLVGSGSGAWAAGGPNAPGTAPSASSAGQATSKPASAEPAVKSAAVAASDTGGIAEIIVTAQRRSENLQRVPIAVAAVSSKALLASGVTNIGDIAAVVPGIVINRLYAGVNPYLRGIGASTTGFTSEEPVATYIDGIYIPNAASGLFAFNNIERVEVLKGPQGTLFGRNAVGGLINVITRDPTQDTQLEGYLSYGSYDTVGASVYATTGIAENLASDIALLVTNQGEGWGGNVATGSALFKRREISASFKTKWEPTPATTVTLRVLYDNNHSTQGVAFGIFPGSVAPDGEHYIDKYQIAAQFDPYLVSEQANAGLKIEHNLGALRLVGLSGYNHIDSDFLSVSNGVAGRPITGQSAVNLRLYGHSDTFSQEVQLLSAATSKLEWIVGGFYLHDHFLQTNLTTPTCVAGSCAGLPQAVRSVANQQTESVAGFGEATLHAGERTRLTAGLRYTYDHKDVSKAFREPLPGYPGATPAFLPPPNSFDDVGGVGSKASFSRLTWRGVAARDLTDDVLLYASYNRGFKAGAFNSITFANPVVRPEVLDAYELGLKSTLFDRMLQVNLSGFYYNYQDIQLRTFLSNIPGTASTLYNAAKAHISGLDTDFVLAPSKRLTISGGGEVLDAHFVLFPNGPCTSPRPITGRVLGGAVTTPCSLNGYRMPRAPRFTANIGVTYRLPTGVGDFVANATDTYNSGFFWEVDNRLRQAAYHQVSATLTWTPPRKHFDIQLFVKNLNNPYYLAGVVEASAGSADEYTPGEPRTFGARLGFHL